MLGPIGRVEGQPQRFARTVCFGYGPTHIPLTLYDQLRIGLKRIDTGATGAEISELIQDLQAEMPYHWRLRLRYHPATTPFQQTSRWLTVPWNGWAEQDLRTGRPAIYLYLPTVHNSWTAD